MQHDDVEDGQDGPRRARVAAGPHHAGVDDEAQDAVRAVPRCELARQHPRPRLRHRVARRAVRVPAVQHREVDAAGRRVGVHHVARQPENARGARRGAAGRRRGLEQRAQELGEEQRGDAVRSDERLEALRRPGAVRHGVGADAGVVPQDVELGLLPRKLLGRALDDLEVVQVEMEELDLASSGRVQGNAV